MTTVHLPAALTARLIRLGARCAVDERTVVLAGLALLLRRYTGRTRHTVRFAERDAVLTDTAADAPVGVFLAAARTWSAAPAGTPAPEPDPPFPGEIAVAPALEGPQWTVHLPGCPAELVEPFTADLVAMLDALAADPHRSTVDLLPVAAYERHRPADPARLHGGPVSYSPGPTIPATFAAQVAAHADRPAVLAASGYLTYRQLGSSVVATARALRDALGPAGGPGRVALLCRHGAETVTGLLGALTAGYAYVPLDPSFPPLRLAQVLASGGARALLVDASQERLAAQVVTLADRPDLPIVPIGQPDPGAALNGVALDELLAALPGPARPDDPAYVLFTSGSTGAPKGVVQSHRNVLFGIANHVRNFAITPADRTSVLSSFGYDMAVTDLFSAILSGAAAVPVDVRTHGLGHLAKTLARQCVTIYHSTPTVYRYLVASLGEHGRLPDIRAVLLGGEEVTRHDVTLARRHFAPRAVFVNGYGTTEISFAAQWHIAPDTPVEDAVVPIGAPLPGIDMALLDAAGRPTCLTGEICVRTPHVALGYLGRPDLTARRFVERAGVRAYLTGDLGRRLPDGRLVFLGRTDRLVKIRGHRVELGEIEAALAALPGVAQAAVIARPRPGGEGTGDQEIIGYVVPGDGPLDPAVLRAALAANLPDFMLPRVIVRVDALPMGATGKLAVDALPEREISTVDGLLDEPVERAIAAAWCEVLGLATVGRHATFLELGGHSLLLARIQQRLESDLGRQLPLALLFEYPTIAGLAAHLRSPDAASAADPALARAAGRMRRRHLARHAAPATSEEVG